MWTRSRQQVDPQDQGKRGQHQQNLFEVQPREEDCSEESKLVSAMVNLRPLLLSPARDIRGRSNRRLAVEEHKVAFKEHLPLALKNRVQGSSDRAPTKVCMDEMMGVLVCLEKFDQNQSMCQSEVESFNRCFDRVVSEGRAVAAKKARAQLEDQAFKATARQFDKPPSHLTAQKKVGGGEHLSGQKLTAYMR